MCPWLALLITLATLFTLLMIAVDILYAFIDPHQARYVSVASKA